MFRPVRPTLIGMRRSCKPIVAAAVLCAGGPAIADDEAPEQAGYVESIAFEEVLPNEPGEWDVRVSVTATRAPVAMTAGTGTFLVPSAQLYFGITRRLGGEIALPFVMRIDGDREAALGNAGFGLKYLALAQAGWLPSLSVMAEVSPPTSTESSMSSEGAELEGALGAALVRSGIVVQAAIGVSSTFGDERELALVHNLSTAVALPARFHAFAEVVGETELAELETSILAGPGLRYAIGRELSVAASGLVGVAGDAHPRAQVQVQYGF
jgi:hypothetical protein